MPLRSQVWLPVHKLWLAWEVHCLRVYSRVWNVLSGHPSTCGDSDLGCRNDSDHG